MTARTCNDPWTAKTCGDCKHNPDNATSTTPAALFWPTLRGDGRCCDWQARRPHAITPSQTA